MRRRAKASRKDGSPRSSWKQFASTEVGDESGIDQESGIGYGGTADEFRFGVGSKHGAIDCESGHGNRSCEHEHRCERHILDSRQRDAKAFVYNTGATITDNGDYLHSNGGRVPASPAAGTNYFYGSPSGSASGASNTLTQTISQATLNAYTGLLDSIDAGTATYNLSAWLGGYYNQNDNARVTITFQTAAGVTVGTPVTIGPVILADRATNLSEMLSRSSTGAVPRELF